MSEDNRSLRTEVAASARQYLQGQISYETFMSNVPDTEDETIRELVNMIVHGPKEASPFGTTNQDFDSRQERLKELIEALET